MNFHINSWRKNIVRLRAHHLITNTLRFRSYIYFDKNERNKTATFHEILCLTYCEADVVVVAIVLSFFEKFCSFSRHCVSECDEKPENWH